MWYYWYMKKYTFGVIILALIAVLVFLFITNRYGKTTITPIQHIKTSQSPIIKQVFGPLNSSYQYGPEGTITAGKVASVYGSGLLGNLIFTFSSPTGTYKKEVKAYNDGTGLKDNIIYDGYIELIVPKDLNSSVVNITVTNDFGTSNSYQAKTLIK
jgi:hypothetical protein